ncbi:WLM domain-containing protein, partial [Paraphysoderma sedebokerense]
EDDKYTFHRIAVLPQFSNQAGAQKILERLKSDLGIRGIMKHYKWSVGSLIELSPAEQTILGYNRNKGEVIALRLRTDDLEGFRTYDSIRKVLLHELAHMVHSEHDSNFHTLNRQLNKDVVNLDWTSRGGQPLSTAQYYNPEEEEEVEGPLFEGGVFRLGGSSKDEAGPGRDNETPEQRRERLARAVLIRLTKEEKEVVEGCGSGKVVKDNTTNSE